MYFQWRKSLGAAEKFHGAVVDHGEAERTRVFADVAAHGAFLKRLDAVVGTTVRPEAALVYDTEVRWALMYSQGPRQTNPRTPFDKEYAVACQEHYRPFWKLGIPVRSVIESLSDFTRYRLIVAPMLFMLKPGVVDRLEVFVRGGGTLLLTYLSGVVNETALVLRGGWPGGGIRKMAGIWSEEIDALYPNPPQRLAVGRQRPGHDRRASREGLLRARAPGGRDGPRHVQVRLLCWHAGAHRQQVRRRARVLPCGKAGRRPVPRLAYAGTGVAGQGLTLPGGRVARGRDGAEALGRRAHVLLPAQLPAAGPGGGPWRHPAEGRQRRPGDDRQDDAGAVRVVRPRAGVEPRVFRPGYRRSPRRETPRAGRGRPGCCRRWRA